MAVEAGAGAGAPSPITDVARRASEAQKNSFLERMKRLSQTISSLSALPSPSLEDRCQSLSGFLTTEANTLPKTLSHEEVTSYLENLLLLKKTWEDTLPKDVEKTKTIRGIKNSLYIFIELLTSIKRCFENSSITITSKAYIPPFFSSVLKTVLVGERYIKPQTEKPCSGLSAHVTRKTLGDLHLVVKETHTVDEKGIPLTLTQQIELRRYVLREIGVFFSLPPHPNICRLAYPIIEPLTARLYLEAAESDLYTRMTSKPFSCEEIISIFSQILQGIEHMHKHNTIHSDIKPDNILYFPKGIVKITDFGFSISPGNPQKGQTYIYASPESIKNKPLTTATDIWSFGAFTLTVTAQACLFNDACAQSEWFSDQGSIDKAINHYLSVDFIQEQLDSTDPERKIVALARRCLRVIPSERPTATKLLQDPLFTSPERTLGKGGGGCLTVRAKRKCPRFE